MIKRLALRLTTKLTQAQMTTKLEHLRLKKTLRRRTLTTTKRLVLMGLLTRLGALGPCAWRTLCQPLVLLGPVERCLRQPHVRHEMKTTP